MLASRHQFLGDGALGSHFRQLIYLLRGFPIRREHEANLMLCALVVLCPSFARVRTVRVRLLGNHLHLVFAMSETMASHNGPIR
jgi:hypothetical protein